MQLGSLIARGRVRGFRSPAVAVFDCSRQSRRSHRRPAILRCLPRWLSCPLAQLGSLSSARSRFSEIKLAHGSADGLLPLHHPLLLLHHRNPHQAPPPLHPLGLPRGAQRSWPPAPRQTSPGAPRLQGRPPTLLARCSGQERGRGGAQPQRIQRERAQLRRARRGRPTARMDG